MLLNDSEMLSQLIQASSLNEQKETVEQLDYLLRPEVRFCWDFRFAAANYFYIIDKNKQKVNFIFNSLQEKLYRELLSECPIRSLIIKSRKFGISTFLLLLYYWDSITTENTTSVIIANDFDSTKRLFKIVSYAHDNLTMNKPKCSLDNTREMMFSDLNSVYFVGSAQKMTFGRGDTINNLHCSELAFWPDPEGLLGSALAEAVPELTGNVVVETTPSRHPYLREIIDSSKHTDKPFHYKFYPWHVFPSYRLPVESEKEEEDIMGELTAEEKIAMQIHHLDIKQMAFWLNKRRKLKRKVWQEYPMDDVTCFIATDENNFFDTRKLQELYLICQGFIPVYEMQNGNIKIYDAPIPGEKYLIAADTSGGGVNSTYSTATVVRDSNAEEAAELRARITPVQLAKSLDVLGRMYNIALVIVERNNHGHSVLNTLENQLFYPNIYYHVDLDKAEYLKKISKIGGGGLGGGYDPFKQGEAGWPTDARTRPIMFDDLREEVIDEQQMLVKSLTFIEECFGVKTKGDKIYSDGYLDTVIARAIVWQVRKRLLPAALIIKNAIHHQSTNSDRQLPWNKSSIGNELTPQTLNHNRHKMRRDDKRVTKAPWVV